MNTSLIVLVLALTVFTAYLAAIETVIDRLNLVRALRLDDEDRPGSAALLWLTEHRSSALSAVLVATVTARVTLVAAAISLAVRFVPSTTGMVVTLVGVVVVSLVVGEVTPRTVALRHLEATGLRLAASARVVVRAVGPIARLFVAAGRGLVPRRHEVSGPYASDEELHELDSDDEEEDPALEPEERAMIRSIFELADTRVREIMTPRPDMVTVGRGEPLDALIAAVTEQGFSRVPVHESDDADEFVGIVYAKDLLACVADRGNGGGWEDLVREATFVPEIKRVDELLRDLQASAVHMALVVDEYGAIVGVVTIEDILEEIVGEIVDEHDHEEPLVEVCDGGVLRIDARLGVDDLNEMLSSTLPEEGWDTVGGLVFGTLGRVPEVGESVELDGHVLTVESVQGRRVGKVLVAPGSRVGTADDATGNGDVARR
ncbi:MAG: hemolysin family protein [Nitriliruptoraceae bacterium]